MDGNEERIKELEAQLLQVKDEKESLAQSTFELVMRIRKLELMLNIPQDKRFPNKGEEDEFFVKVIDKSSIASSRSGKRSLAYVDARLSDYSYEKDGSIYEKGCFCRVCENELVVDRGLTVCIPKEGDLYISRLGQVYKCLSEEALTDFLGKPIRMDAEINGWYVFRDWPKPYIKNTRAYTVDEVCDVVRLFAKDHDVSIKYKWIQDKLLMDGHVLM